MQDAVGPVQGAAGNTAQEGEERHAARNLHRHGAARRADRLATRRSGTAAGVRLRARLPVCSRLRLAAVAAAVGAWLVPERKPLDRLASDRRAAFGARDVLLTDSATTTLRLAIQGALAALLANLPLERLMAGARAPLAPAQCGSRELAGMAGQWLVGRPAVYGLPSALPFLNLGRTICHSLPPRNARRRSGRAVCRLA